MTSELQIWSSGGRGGQPLAGGLRHLPVAQGQGLHTFLLAGGSSPTPTGVQHPKQPKGVAVLSAGVSAEAER